MAHDIPVVGAGRIQQQQCVAGWCGVHNHEFPPSLPNNPGKGLEHGNFLGAGGAQIFLEHSAAFGIQVGATGCHDMFAVCLGFHLWIDAADGEMVNVTRQSFGQVCRRIGRGQQYLVATGCQFHRDRCGDGGFTDPALAHGHDQTFAIGLNLVCQAREWR